MNSPNLSTLPADVDARVARFGLLVAARLTEGSTALPHDVSERLRFAREQAVARAAQARAARTAAASTSPMTVQMGSTLALGGGAGPVGGRGGEGGLWAKLVSILPLLALLAGLLLMHQGQLHQQLVATAEVDTALLSDNLPPAAFRDPGFAEFLRDGQE